MNIDFVKKCDVFEDCHLCFLVDENSKHMTRRFGGNSVSSNLVRNNTNRNKKVKRLSRNILPLKNKSKNHNSSNYLTKIKNDLDKNLSVKEKQHLSAMLIKSAVNTLDTGGSSDHTISLSQVRGKPLKITLGSEQNNNNNNSICLEDFNFIRNKYNLSRNESKNMATDLRNITGNKHLFEKNVETKLDESTKQLAEFFTQTSVDFTNTKNGKETVVKETVVYCHRVEELAEFIQSKRNEPYVHLKLGVDGGGGSLKITLSIQSIIANKDDKQNGLGKFKDTGVKKIIILAIVHNVQENHNNIQELFNLLKIDVIDNLTFAADLKLLNILTGIQPHSSMFPCCWCLASKNDLQNRGNTRTIGNLLENFEEWKSAGGIKKNAKNFKSCIHQPLFQGPPNMSVLQVLPPPELHLMIGVVNKIVEFMLEVCPTIVNEWLRRCHVLRQVTRTGPSFTGNSAKKLLDNIDLLRSMADFEILKYIEVLHNFKNVVHDCFGDTLRPTYKLSIQKFRESYLSLKKSVTPKIHAVFYHVQEFCQENNCALSFYGEQSVESVHHDWKSIWKNYLILDRNHPQFPNRLLRAVCEYNCLHI